MCVSACVLACLLEILCEVARSPLDVGGGMEIDVVDDLSVQAFRCMRLL